MNRHRSYSWLAPAACAAVGSLALAQTSGTTSNVQGVIFLDDPDSNSQCAIVNTAANEFVIRTCDRQLVLVTASDEVTGYFVDSQFDVTSNGAPRGRIGYATDGDGFRTVFWVTDDSFGDVAAGHVLNYDVQSGAVEPFTSMDASGNTMPIRPSGIRTNGQFCDPTNRFDGNAACPASSGAPCGGAGVSSAMIGGLLWLGLVRSRRG